MLTKVDYRHGDIVVGQAAVAHCGIVAEEGTFFDTAQGAAHDAEAHYDHALGFGHDVAGIHLLGSAFESIHRSDTDEIRAQALGQCLDFC